MTRSLNEILEGLSAEEGKLVTDAIEAEKQRGIEESRRRGGDIKKFMTLANRYKDLLKSAEIDPDAEDLEEQFNQKISANKTAMSDSEKKLKEIEKQLKAISQKAEEKELIATEKTLKLQRSKLTEVLKGKLGNKIYGTDYVVRDMISQGRVKLAEDDETVSFIEGNEEFAIDKGIERFLKANPDLVKNQQTPGSGSAPGSGKSSRSMSEDEWLNLGDKERASFILNNGKIV